MRDRAHSVRGPNPDDEGNPLHLPADLPGHTEEEFGAVPVRHFEKEYGIHLTEINQMLSAVVIEREQLEAFDLLKPTPAFRVEGVSFAGKELIVEMEDSIYRGDIPFRCQSRPLNSNPMGWLNSFSSFFKKSVDRHASSST